MDDAKAGKPVSGSNRLEPAARIAELTLYTSQPDALFSYFGHDLGLKVTAGRAHSFAVEIGASVLIWDRAEKGTFPIYHYAINIPENQFPAAKAWLERRTPLIPDSETGLDEVYFKAWDAHSVYFKDPAGNIGELIARHSLKNASSGNFNRRSLLCISEIGLPVENPLAAQQALKDSFGLTPYLNSDMFSGDENGIFITSEIGRPWMPDRTMEAIPFPLKAKLNENELTPFGLPGHPFSVSGIR